MTGNEKDELPEQFSSFWLSERSVDVIGASLQHRPKPCVLAMPYCTKLNDRLVYVNEQRE